MSMQGTLRGWVTLPGTLTPEQGALQGAPTCLSPASPQKHTDAQPPALQVGMWRGSILETATPQWREGVMRSLPFLRDQDKSWRWGAEEPFEEEEDMKSSCPQSVLDPLSPGVI